MSQRIDNAVTQPASRWLINELKKDQALFWLLLMVMAVVVLGQVGHQLWTPDEPREAAIALEMFRSGDWVVPTLSGVSFIEKPPLYYIISTCILALLGDQVNPTAVLRIVGMLWAVGILAFTGLLAKRLFSDNRAALWTLIALGTMEGFILNTHWIRVDSALAFFVIFTLWAFAEYYLAGKTSLLIVAGLGLSGAFLTKGPIGPLSIFFGWAALFVVTFRDQIARRGTGGLILQHLLMAICFLLPVAFWLNALIHHSNGAELWKAWFWDNQVGRMTGSSTELGHMKPQGYFYYLLGIAEYTLPWAPLVLAWFWKLKSGKWDKAQLFLLVWAIGTVVLLSCSATKRTLYLLPLMPVFALMMGQLSLNWPSWTRYVGRVWVGLMLLFSAVLLLAPFIVPNTKLAGKMPDAVLQALSHPDWSYAWACILVIIGAGLAWRMKKLSGEILTASASGIMFLLTFVQVFPLIDKAKGMENSVQHFLTQIPAAERPHVGAWKLGETELGFLSVYGHWPVNNLTAEQVQAVLNCSDVQYHSVLVAVEPPDNTLESTLGSHAYKILGQMERRGIKHERELIWLSGNCQPVTP